MTPALRPTFEPALVLLLHADPADAVTRALVDGRAPLGWPLTAVSVGQLLDAVEFGADAWTVAGRRIDPQRTAIVNRLPIADHIEAGADTSAAAVARQAIWTRLRSELGGFGYASSLPTATSVGGCFGSLLDQWQDLPRLVPGLRVPAHSAASVQRDLHGAVFSVNRWTPYSLGQPRDPQAPGAGGPLPPALRLDYARPPGQLVHLAQIGDTMFFPNAPPSMTAAQQQAMVGVARALALVSTVRILEHAFFVGGPGDGEPVLYSSFPVPVLSGRHPLYPELVRQGLRNDIQKWRGRH